MLKNYNELKLEDNFVFCKVVTSHPDLCRQIIELILDKKIRKIEFLESEKALDISPNSHGIRMDVYLDDEEGTVYDLEMQTTKNPNLAKRIRYYQGVIDLNHLSRGAGYQSLPQTVIIFICTFDPFGCGIPVYTFENRCIQDTSLSLNDMALKLFVNTHSIMEKADNTQLTQMAKLDSFFKYMNQELVTDEFTQKLHDAVIEARQNEEWEAEYMHWRAFEMDMEWAKQQAIAASLEEGRAEGMEQGRAEGMEQGRAEGMEQGRAEGLEEGRAEGMEQGRAEGMEQGRAEGLEEGRAEGLEEGRAEGLEEGRAEGEFLAIYKLYSQSVLTTEQAISILSITEEAFLEGYEAWKTNKK